MFTQVPKYPAAAQSLHFIISYQSNVWPNPASVDVYLGSSAQQAGSTVTYSLGSLRRDTEYAIQIRARAQFSACSSSMFGEFSDVMTFRTNNTCMYHNV